MDHKTKMDEAARDLTGMPMDAIFAKSEEAIQRAAQDGAVTAVIEDVKASLGVEISEEVAYHVLVCGFSLSLVLAQAAAQRYLDREGAI